MEESSGAQYALQVALQTLKDRCQQFQQRIADLETENLDLRTKFNDNTCLTTLLPGTDNLVLEIAKLTEEKTQLSKRVEMVTTENNNLWSHLSKLTQVKQTLDSKLTKIGDTILNRTTHTNLVRSKTFTQDEPHIVIPHENIQDESAKLSLELEDISLKLLNSIAKEKHELEMQCSQMAEMQMNDSLFSNSYAFMHPGEAVTECDQLEKQLTSLRNIKFALLKQKEKLENIESLISSRANTCGKCRTGKNTISTAAQTSHNREIQPVIDEESAQLQSLMNWGTPHNSFDNNLHISETKTNIAKEKVDDEHIKMCPMCSKIFYNTSFEEFQKHVEQHFVVENDIDIDII